MDKEVQELIEQANQVYKKNFSPECWFERAVFLSWYCSLGDCKFCYMSTQKNKISDPEKARRRLSSVLAELILSNKLGWEIEFLSTGYGSYTQEELIELLKISSETITEKLWLNIGYLDEKEINKFLPYVKGVSASIETVNWELRKEVCPSKPVEPMLKMLELADKYNLKKAITIIIGLGEKIEDIEELFKFIEKYKLDRVTFYSLNPHEGTPFTKGPETEYYVQWIAKTRIKYPKLEIIAGSWVNRIEEINLLLKSGANAFTKFPALKLFNSSFAKQIEEETKKARRELKGSLTEIPTIDWKVEINKLNVNENLKEQILLKLKQYLKRMNLAKD
jgi:biotin synthase-like enzyme